MKTAYEMRISDWSSDVCSSDLEGRGIRLGYVVANPRPCDGEPQILIDLLALEQVLKSAGQMLTDSLQIDRGTALRALYDEGVLIAEERKGRMPRYTVQRVKIGREQVGTPVNNEPLG